MRTDYSYYQVLRSRNKGEFWSDLTSGQELGWDEANRIMEQEKEKHPSDWLKLVKVQATTIRDYTGNKKKSVKKSDSKEPRIHGYTVPEYIQLIQKAHEATKNSKLVFK